MHVIVSFTLVPVNSGISLSPYIAACRKIIEASGLISEYHSNGTNVEGDWDNVFSIIKTCQLKVHEMGADRVFTTIQVSTRTDIQQNMNHKLRSVEKLL